MFPLPMAAKLSGASIAQLRNWSATNLFVPEHGKRPRYLYSFRDVLALRTVAKLRTEVSLQKVRLAFNSLAGMDLTEHPSSYQLLTDGDSIFLIRDDAITDLVHRRGQPMLTSLQDVFDPFTNQRGERVVDLRHPRPNLEIREARLAGWPTVRHTRVPYDLVAALMEDVPAASVSEFYPGVSAAAARDALSFHESVQGTAS